MQVAAPLRALDERHGAHLAGPKNVLRAETRGTVLRLRNEVVAGSGGGSTKASAKRAASTPRN